MRKRGRERESEKEGEGERDVLVSMQAERGGGRLS